MSNFKNIPPEIARKLDQSVRRVRSILLFRGICMVTAVAVASMLGIMAIDAMVTIFSHGVRWGLWAAAVGATGATAWFALVKPLRRRFSAWEIAALIERNHPELEERLSTVVGLLEAGDVAASKDLVEALTLDAIRYAGTDSPKQEFTSRTVKPRLVAAIAVVCVLVGLFVAFPNATRRLATRALVPSAEVDNIYASSLKVSPGDIVLLKGSSLTVNLAVDEGFPSKAYVRTRVDGRSEAVERMNPTTGEGDSKAFYEFNYPQVQQSFTYRMNCGGGLTRGYRVTVVPEPSYSDRVIELEHPAYTQREPVRYTNSCAVVGLPGSKVRVTVRPSDPSVDGRALLTGGRTVPATRLEDGRLQFAFTLDKSVEGQWGISVWDGNGFSNQVETASVSLVKDVPPEITLLQPASRELKLPSFGEMPLQFEVKEDFGLARAVLEMAVGAGAWEDSETLDLTKTGGVTWTGDTTVRFASKPIGRAGAVRFRVRVEDNLPTDLGGPGVAYSPDVTVALSSKDTSLARQALAGQIDASRKEQDEIRKHLEQAHRNAGYAVGGFMNEKGGWFLENARKNLSWCKSDMLNAERLMSAFIENLADSRLQGGVDLFTPVQKDHIVPTRQEIEDIFLLARDKEKGVACSNAVPHIKACLDALFVARRKFDALTKAAVDLQKLADFAEREKALAELAEEGKIDAKELAEREEELAKKFAEEFKDELQKNLDWQKKVAADMAKKTEELEQRQDALKEKAAAAQTDEEKKAVADAERKLAEDIKNHANRLGDLVRDIESKAGPVEADENKTAQPVKDAQKDEYKASNEAREASEKLQNGDMDGAKEDMEAVSAALEKAKQDLAAAQDKMDAKNAEFAENASDYKDMQQAMNEALNAAKEAAAEQAAQEAAAEQAAQQNGEQQQGQQQQGDQQQQQQGDQQQQQGQQQQGDQQQGQQQQQSEAMQKAQQAAQQAANKMQEKAQQQADQNNLPMDQFQPDSQSESSDASQNQQSNAQSKHDDKQRPEKEGRPRTAEEQDETDDGEEWFKMKSESETGADADNLDDVPAEYRDLVKDYFDALNKGGRK